MSAEPGNALALRFEQQAQLVVTSRGLVRRLAHPLTELAELGVHRPRHLPRRRRRELHAHGVEHAHQHRARGVVPVDLPAPDVAPIRADGMRQLLLRQTGTLAQIAEPLPERRIGLRRRTPI